MNKTKKKKTYVVVRDDVRVSDKEYSNKKDGTDELNYWVGLIKKWPDGSKIEIVEKNSRKHRVYNL